MFIFIESLQSSKSTDRSIKEDLNEFLGSMTEQVKEWWKGLGKELEIDIETIEQSP